MNRKIAIIGGGASGLAAAVVAANNAAVTVYERNDRVGKKLLQTGNGRCNLLNTGACAQKFHSQNMDAVQRVIDTFDALSVMGFFEDLGLLMSVEEEGRVYPMCNQASAVLDVLRFAAAEHGAQLCCGRECTGIKKQGSAFLLEFADGKRERADAVILACGGKAAPKTGSDGAGYRLARQLGHSVTKLSPALVALKSASPIPRALKGIRAKASLSLVKNGIEIAKEDGEVQFTDYGISGIAAMQLSRFISDGKYEVVLDLAKDFDEEYIEKCLKKSAKKGREMQDLTLGILQKRVGQQLIKDTLAIGLGTPTSQLSDNDIKRIAKAIKGWHLPIDTTLGWDNAQVSAGGVPISELDVTTFESKICRGLYIVGELLDCDGACGGYNLYWAWSSGIIAARAAGEEQC